jgi:hypothetical protein
MFMIFGPKLSVCSLENLKPLLLSLCPSRFIKSPVLDILSPVCVRLKRIWLILKCKRDMFVKVYELLIIEFDIFVPDALKFAKLLHPLLFIRLPLFRFWKNIEKLSCDLVDFSLKEIAWLFLLGKESFFSCFKVYLHKYSLLYNPIVG